VKIKVNCSKCQRQFELGYNGIIGDGGLPLCDTCGKVKRDANEMIVEAEGYTFEDEEKQE
jgi:NAD-dependent SIR2 family protein deacetylase